MWKAARNEFITKTMALMRGLSRRFWFEHYRRVGDLPLAATLHSKMAEAIARGHSKDAAVASDRLVDYIESFARDHHQLELGYLGAANWPRRAEIESGSSTLPRFRVQQEVGNFKGSIT